MKEEDKFLIENEEEKQEKAENVCDDFDYDDDFYSDYDDECIEECKCDNCKCHHEYDEKIIDETLMEDFTPHIVERGEEYYLDGHVVDVYKDKNTYYSHVIGSMDEPYEVKITIYSEDNAEYECNCPCEFPCKHVYATILAIRDGEYEEVELKDKIEEKEENIKEILTKIPAEEIKEYLLSDNGIDNVCFEMNEFNHYFRKYLPKQDYTYFYNNLYNALVLGNDYEIMIDDYIAKARNYLKDNCFKESFKIIKSIIEAMHDSNLLDVSDDDFELINKLGMLLRIIYRKCDTEDKNEINNWASLLKEKDYYNNYYLEDVIISLK